VIRHRQQNKFGVFKVSKKYIFRSPWKAATAQTHENFVKWWGQVLEDGTCIDSCDGILPSDPEYAEKRNFILAFKRGGAWTRLFAQDQSRPKLLIKAWERDEEWTKPSKVRSYLEPL
jgi:hypothetical protein